MNTELPRTTESYPCIIHHCDSPISPKLIAKISAFSIVGAMLFPTGEADMSVTVGYTNDLEGSIEIAGEVIIPPGDGKWSTLSVLGRPEFRIDRIVAEITGNPNPTVDGRSGPKTSKPNVGVPAAVRVGLHHAGVSSMANETIQATADYDIIPLIEDNVVLGNIYTGGSHGMIWALYAYSYAAGADLTQGRHIAGTGAVDDDGIVKRIGSLPTKARAAYHEDVDVFMVPASQIDQIDPASYPGMEIIPVETLQEAIDYLSDPVLIDK